MKKLLSLVIILTITNPVSISLTNTRCSCTFPWLNKVITTIHQDTIYIDPDTNQLVATSEKNLSHFKNVKKIIQIGFFKNENGEIQAVTMPKSVEEVPKQLPSQITSLSRMFAFASQFNQDLSTWNTANVTNMNGMFVNATAFNGNISTWNTSKVIDMSAMFIFSSSFNQSLSNWNTSKVTDMSYMFYEAVKFNQSLLKWDTSHVTNMRGMFYGAETFDQDLSKWDTSHVTNMRGMFQYALSFNSNISGWETLNVENMSSMFYSATAFDQNLSGWKVNNVTAYANFVTNSKIAKQFNKWPKFNDLDFTDQQDTIYIDKITKQKVLTSEKI